MANSDRICTYGYPCEVMLLTLAEPRFQYITQFINTTLQPPSI